MVHISYLTNLFISAAIVASFYHMARWMGYTTGVALVAAVMMGVATHMWIYSRLLFREPLLALLIIWAYGLTNHLRREWPKESIPWQSVFLLAMILAAMVLTKVVALLTIPGFAILVMPDRDQPKARRQYFVFVVVTIVVLVGAALLLSRLSLLTGTRYHWDRWALFVEQAHWTSVIESVLGYQVSPGRSIWLYSPVLLPGLYGAWLLWRRGDWRLVVAPLIMVLLFSAGYGTIHGTVWWGGWSWGPRYFVPLLPLLMIWLLPVIERSRNSRLPTFLLATFTAAGIVIQLLGIAVPTVNYYSDQYFLGNTNLFGVGWNWMPANWQWVNSPITYHVNHFDPSQLNIAWRYAEPGWFAPLFGLLVIGMVIAAALWTRSVRQMIPVLGLSGVLLLIGISSGLRSLANDRRYRDEWPAGTELVTQLNTTIAPDAAVLIERGETLRIFMNALKTPRLAATLPYPPGENYGQGAQLESDRLFEQIGAVNGHTILWMREHYSDIWFITGSSPFETEKRRPVERYLSISAYFVEEINAGLFARAVHFYVPDDAPVLLAEDAPNHEVNRSFSDALLLEGFDLPAGDTVERGGMLPVSLAWIPEQPLDFDYHVNLILTAADGFTVAERSGQPQATFGFMTRWPPGKRQRDNLALKVPPNLPPGEYYLRLVVYNWQTGERFALDESGDMLDLAVITVE
jgi:hypothetical protein